MNRSRRNWRSFFGKSHGHEILEKMECLSERGLLQEIGQNSDAPVFSSSAVVAIYVKKNSEHAVKWALDNLVFEGDQLMLIYVRRPIDTVPTPMGNYVPITQVSSDIVAAHVRKIESQILNLLRPFQHMCNNRKVQGETIVLEDYNTQKAILKYISCSGISKLVMGSSRHLISRKLKGHDMPSIAMKASKFCSVYVISKGKLALEHPSNNLAEDSSICSLEDNVLSREPGEIDTNDEIGNQSFGNNGRDLEGPILSKMSKPSFFSGSLPDIETNLGRLKIELQHTREVYRGTLAFEEAIAAKYKAEGLNTQLIEKLWKFEETEDAFESADQGCREYSIGEIEFATDFFSESRKIGEGGYGPVYKGSLDHTTVAIKVLRTDAAQGRREFQREIEVLSRIHHPNMVLLLGTCPERGCLVYEYMENGSLEDRLFHSDAGDSLPWFTRFRIASEIASALHFLHTAKPEPILHRDLKPANILLDQNLVSKIGDVGLARLIPSAVSRNVTECKSTVFAGTFCYMDPEYLRSETLCPMSDIYALGIIFLQLLTAKPPMALTGKVETAIQESSFNRDLDKTAGDWPLKETIEFAKLALRCTELQRRDRPDLETVILPQLERFRDLADEHVEHCAF